MDGRTGRDRPLIFPVSEYLLAAFAIALCWHGVSWAFKPGLVLMQDEVANLGRFLDASYYRVVQPIPHAIYNERPAGFALVRLLFDVFRFDYNKQLSCFIAIHFANCIMAFALFRRLHLSVPLCLAAVGVYGSLSTTALTATYIGAVFDVLCLFFILGSALAILSQRRGAPALSAFLFLLALLSKEFAIVLPVLLALLVFSQLPPCSVRIAFVSVARRLWLHFAIGAAFVLRYLSFIPEVRRTVSPQDPYHMSFTFDKVLSGFGYYTSLIFGAEASHWGMRAGLVGLALGAVLVYALVFRRRRLVFAMAAYVLTLLPVTLIQVRVPFYLYAPQLFLLFAVFLLADEAINFWLNSARPRWLASVAIAIVCLLLSASFDRRHYFRDRVNFMLDIRTKAARSSKDAAVLFGTVPAGAHVYVNHGNEMPWLFIGGPCAFLKLINLQRSITCVLNTPEALLRNLYEADIGPKFLVNYNSDGSLWGFKSAPAKRD